MSIPDRRRSPRTPIRANHAIAIDVPMEARLVDVSVSGVLLASPIEIAVGERRQLRVVVGSHTIDVAIEVRHTSIDRRGGRPGYLAGAIILPTSLEQRGQLEALFGRKA